MQRDYYLPLKVIRGYLDDLDAGREPVLPGGATVAGAVDARRATAGSRRDELIREAGATPMLLQRCGRARRSSSPPTTTARTR